MKNFIWAFCACAVAVWGQCPATYTAQRAISVNSGQVTGTLTDYPMLVLNPTSGVPNPNNLKTTGNGGRVTSANGYDIIFVNGAGALLPFELVGHGQSFTSYAPSTGSAEFHVNVASIADGTAIYMCYGNSAVTTYQGNDSATWSGYKGVWHFPDAAGLTNSAGGTVMTPVGAPTTAVGKIGGGLGLDGASQAVGNSANLAESNSVNFTVSAWVYPNSATGYGQIFSSGGGFSARIQFRRDQSDWMLYVKNSTSSYVSAGFAGGVTPNAWAYLVATWDGANIKLYVNGVLKATTPDPSPTTFAGTVNDWGYNTDGGPSTWWNGRIDEGRVLSAALSASWIASEYSNQNTPSSFYTVGPETAPSAGAPMSSVPVVIPNGHSGNITLSLTGSGTAWNNATTVFTVAGVSNVTKVSQNVTSPTAATLVLRTGAGTGTLNIAETVTGLAYTSVDVAVPSFSIDVGRGNLNSIQTLSLTGTNTLWNQEAAAGLFAVTGGNGSNIGTAAISTNTVGTVALTVGSLAGTLTITDTSTGKTATFAAGGQAGLAGCHLVIAQ